MNRISLTERVHQRLRQYISAGDIVIDATAGNGHDTLFLAECVGNSGVVYSFDVQLQAIKQTAARLEEAGLAGNVQLVHGGHETMGECVAPEHHGKISAIIFNLGYLPGADKSCITTRTTTLQALAAAVELLRPGGMVSVLAYPGHEGGRQETEAAKQWAQELDTKGFTVVIHPPQHANGKSPEWIEIERNR